MHILLLDSHKTTQKTVREIFASDQVSVVSKASDALLRANDTTPDVVVMELSLAGHSGFEFLYEFRTYEDWLETPVVIYSTLKLEDSVLNSRAWKQLNIADYFYKSDTTLAQLKNAIEKQLS